MKYDLINPCDKCPFRNDIPAFLRADRVDEIEESLVNADFPCHKTVDYRDDDEEGPSPCRDTKNEHHCAGALILLEKIERPSQMMRICERLRLYDASKLNMDAPVFDSFEQMRDAQDDSPCART